MAEHTFLEPGAGEGNPANRPQHTFIEGAGSAHGGYQPLPPSLIQAGYRAVRELGAGAEARVWLCTNGAGREVAVKVYFRAPKYTFVLNSPEYLRRFSRDWTVEVLERGCDVVAGSETHYEVMEFCPGDTLEEFLGGRPCREEAATQIVRRLTFCLKSLQGEAKKVVHGDLKPRNILVRRKDPLELVLTDFGLTIDLGERSKLSNLGQGTTAYNAPESMRVKGASADWWSLGMVMYTALVGRGYYQVDGDRWLSQRDIETDLLSHDISLTAIDKLEMPQVRRGRWKMVLAGLLTRSPEKRWGADEVDDWLTGKSPQVWRSVDVAAGGPQPAGARPYQLRPFAVAGVGEFTSPEQLGAAMAARPQDFVRKLSGKGTDELVSWLKEEIRTGDNYSELAKHNWDPDAKLSYFVAKMAPAAPLTFRSQSIATPADLRSLAQNAPDDVVGDLFAAELLGSLANAGVRSGYRMTHENWIDLVSRSTEAARDRGISLTEQARQFIRRHALLLAASDETVAQRYVADVGRRVSGQEYAATREVDWFMKLRADARV